MAFSLRTLIIFITVGGLWLAALLSRSQIFLAITSQVSMLFIALSLGLAIFDAGQARRPFWAGFFIVALGNLAITSLPLGDISRPSSDLQGNIADLIQGDISARPGNDEFVPVTNSNGVTSYISQASLVYQEERHILRGALAACLSLIWGCLAGSTCWWFARK
jgi:hypothetical protein